MKEAGETEKVRKHKDPKPIKHNNSKKKRKGTSQPEWKSKSKSEKRGRNKREICVSADGWMDGVMMVRRTQ